MKRASYIYPCDVFPCDVVKTYCNEDIDFPGRPWCEHFSRPRPVFLKVVSQNTNNGCFLGKDKHGRVHHLHVNSVDLVKRGSYFHKIMEV